MRHNPYVAVACEALEAMGFESMEELETDGQPEYWLSVPPYTVVVLHDHPLAEQRHLLMAISRQLDDAQMALFRELTGW